MAKAILEFDLNDPDDRERYRRTVDVDDVYSCLIEYDEWLRGLIKYTDESEWPSIAAARKKLLGLVNEHDIKMD